jgi:hypothetical protein
MKKLLLYCLLSLLISVINAQVFKIEEKSVTGTFDVNEKTKAEIFSAINKWISINYNSAKNVIQMNELQSGTIIVKGINTITIKNPSKQTYPNNRQIPEFNEIRFNHLIELNIKDNKFRIIYKVVGIESEVYNNLFYNCIRLDSLDNNQIQIYNQYVDDQLKKGLVNKEKRDSFLSLSQPMFIEVCSKLKDDIKLTMLSIEKAVADSNDKW